MPAIDVVVVGLGAMGSAALYHLARRGVRVLGIERFAPGHDRGSSHGLTRIIRLGYFEHPTYVPLLTRAHALWRELEAAAGRRLLTVTGIVEIGRPGSTLVTGTLAASRLHGLPHEVLDATGAMRRFPAFRLPEDFVGVVQPDGGFVLAEPSVLAHVALAKAAGAEVRESEIVWAVEPRAGRVRVVTDRGAIDAGVAVVAAGPWAKQLLPDLSAPLAVTRNVLGWFEPVEPSLFAAGLFPVFLMQTPHGIHYGFPPHAEIGVKVARHHQGGRTVDPDTYDRAVSGADEASIRTVLTEYLPAANGPLVTSKTCLYTETPDGDFVLDAIPGAPHVIVASPCSGHGFKFSPVIGEIVADLATKGVTRHDISRFRLSRFA
jgi:sarcosine oxidase